MSPVLVGDSRASARYFGHRQAGASAPKCYSVPGMKTLDLTKKACPFVNEKLIFVFLIQCDLTLKKNGQVKPNRHLHMSALWKDIQETHLFLTTNNPEAVIVWTIPIVPKFKVPNAVKSLGEAKEVQRRMEKRQLEIVEKMSKKHILFCDLNKVFKGSVSRLPEGSKYTTDGIHPTYKATKMLYHAMFRMLVNINVMNMLAKGASRTAVPSTSTSVPSTSTSVPSTSTS